MPQVNYPKLCKVIKARIFYRDFIKEASIMADRANLTIKHACFFGSKTQFTEIFDGWYGEMAIDLLHSAN